MKSIVMSNSVIYATNDSGRGIFCKNLAKRNGFQQLKGTCQTPRFTTPEQFRQYLRRHHDVTGVKIVDTRGW